MEILAPAGTKEALVAAVEAGADSVYMGIKEMNARRKAKNFNLYDVEVMLDYLHAKGKKLYITLNILMKQREIPEVFDIVNKLASLGIDGVILQDSGLLHIIRKYFPELPCHASTQMTVHNSAGVKFLEREGFSRAILARELSIKEIQEIQKSTSMKLEIFAHGALCFCISGLCIASSFIGGRSGNRGLCTQPCRRLWKTGKKKGYLLSTRDLQALAHIHTLKNIGVAAIKIEGRMRSAEYVGKVVGAYRKALDHNVDATGMLEDFSREKTAHFLDNRKGSILLQPSCSSRLST